jgi:phage tail-like protein
MADDKAHEKTTYPLPVYNYRVDIQGSGKSIAAGFSEVTGLSLSYDPVTYKHGLSFLFGTATIPGMQQPVKVTLKRGVVKDGDLLQTWFENTYRNPFYMERYRDIRISLCDEYQNAVIQWIVYQAMPIRLDAPNFNASANDVAVEALELTAKDLKVDFHPRS